MSFWAKARRGGSRDFERVNRKNNGFTRERAGVSAKRTISEPGRR
jgi:hypothetical protein